MDAGCQLLALLASGVSGVEELAAKTGVSTTDAATTLLKLVQQGEAEGSLPTFGITTRGRKTLADDMFRRVVQVRGCSVLDGETECVVNASNESATLGGGVSHALRGECGPALQAEMRERLRDELGGKLDEGDCMVTSAGASRRFSRVLHVPSVDYSGVKARLDAAGRPTRSVTSPERVRACTHAALREAAVIARDQGRVTSITFPILGAGSGGLPPNAAVQAMVQAVRDFLAEDPVAPIERIVFAVPEPDLFELAERVVRRT